MKKEIEKRIDNHLDTAISPFLFASGNPKPKEKYKSSPTRIKALEIAFKKKADEQK